ncbi:probable RNA-binding protein 46 isoform X2 [Hippocampus comes]|uniref:probable RNA-binding protein 46 isoform X2 n=1 Tax=Hippocampus comes TaxID=109280 RepID=UPI00094E73A0|nr:PREDICTED: probable RNA-binding protein 46 isoform X2 [Hippocampus comes]
MNLMAENGDGCDQELAKYMTSSSGEALPVKGAEEFRRSLSIQLALVALMDKTGYDILQENGQRKYGGPPPNWEGPAPYIDCEVFVGNIPRDLYEDELVPLFETAGTIYELRLMMEFTGDNRGYAFVMEEALIAIQMLNKYEVRPGKFLGVCATLNNCRLFLGCIPKDKSKEEIMEEIKKVTDGLRDVTVCSSSSDAGKHRGFAFLEYETHKAAALARKELIAIRHLWGHTHWVNWAKPDKHGKRANAQHVTVAHVRNLSPSTTEETLQRECDRFKAGAVMRVKKLTTHAFLHFGLHKDAVAVTSNMNGTTIDGSVVEVSLVKPPAEEAGRRSRPKSCQGSKTGRGAKEMIVPRHGGVNECSPQQSLKTPPYFQWKPQYAVGPGKPDKGVFPLFPGTPLYRTSLLLLRPDQIRSAVSLLDLYCCVHNWPPPQYNLFSLLSQNGTLLLVYKVVMPLTQQSFMPDKLCVQLDDAKELAAQNALWNLDALFVNDSSSSPSPMSSDAAPSPDLLR